MTNSTLHVVNTITELLVLLEFEFKALIARELSGVHFTIELMANFSLVFSYILIRFYV